MGAVTLSWHSGWNFQGELSQAGVKCPGEFFGGNVRKERICSGEIFLGEFSGGMFRKGFSEVGVLPVRDYKCLRVAGHRG